jgi:hypothetical protein
MNYLILNEKGRKNKFILMLFEIITYSFFYLNS